MIQNAPTRRHLANRAARWVRGTLARVRGPGLSPFDPAAQTAATFRRVSRTCRVGRYTVLVWRQNLLRRMT